MENPINSNNVDNNIEENKSFYTNGVTKKSLSGKSVKRFITDKEIINSNPKANLHLLSADEVKLIELHFNTILKYYDKPAVKFITLDHLAKYIATIKQLSSINFQASLYNTSKYNNEAHASIELAKNDIRNVLKQFPFYMTLIGRVLSQTVDKKDILEYYSKDKENGDKLSLRGWVYRNVPKTNKKTSGLGSYPLFSYKEFFKLDHFKAKKPQLISIFRKFIDYGVVEKYKLEYIEPYQHLDRIMIKEEYIFRMDIALDICMLALPEVFIPKVRYGLTH